MGTIDERVQISRIRYLPAVPQQRTEGAIAMGRRREIPPPQARVPRRPPAVHVFTTKKGRCRTANRLREVATRIDIMYIMVDRPMLIHAHPSIH
ncbi:hypothetical protein ASZ90_010792 [hydrocarbon metagenome]|uniref:Uncharacterized protein n=1 Tax=hydrocarbon metagenome TaxID=938273 RepID=A0A0W8FGR2_9ZZZZ